MLDKLNILPISYIVSTVTATERFINIRKSKMSDWHFQFNIDIDTVNSIANVKIYGVWREDTAREYAEQFKEEVKVLTGKPWVRLVDLSNWKTASDEVIEVIGELLQWCIDNGIVHSVYIIDNPITYGQLMRMVNEGKAKNITKTFRTRTEAEKYLKEKGFNVASQTDEKGIFK